ncbi:MAG: SIMPL domain-containing protein [Balneolaceae bacterium]
MDNKSVWVLGLCLVAGLGVLGFFLRDAAISYKEYERTVTVRGLSEQEQLADVVVWPIQYTAAGNDLQEVYATLEENADKVQEFLKSRGVNDDEISLDTPLVTDRSAQRYGGDESARFRYVGSQVITVYSERVEEVRQMKKEAGELGSRGVAISGDDYQFRTEYLFTKLNDIKPEMIEEATVEARKVAQKFAEDSGSRLGKIKTASQGQFSISPRDSNNPHIKNVRVVSTIVYYLSD